VPPDGDEVEFVPYKLRVPGPVAVTSGPIIAPGFAELEVGEEAVVSLGCHCPRFPREAPLQSVELSWKGVVRISVPVPWVGASGGLGREAGCLLRQRSW